MMFRQLIDHTSYTYSYLLADPATRASVIIDPVNDQVPAYLQLLEELNLNLVATLDTHTHADHITGSSSLSEATGSGIIQGKGTQANGVTHQVGDNEKIRFGQNQLIAIASPGHTPDSFCYLYQNKEERWLFSGDTLLIRGTGRTDFQEGDAGQQYLSIFSRLLSLPDDTLVYPGHDYRGWTVSTIGEEKAHNPRLQVTSKKDYIDLMSNLKLPKPGLMDIAVPANLRCGRPQ